MKLKIGKKTIVALWLLVVAGGIYYFQNLEKKEEVPKTTVVIVAKDYIPEIVLIDYLQEYMLLGTLLLCHQD